MSKLPTRVMFILLKIKYIINVSGDSRIVDQNSEPTQYAIMFNFNRFRSGRRTWWTRSGCPWLWTASQPPAVGVPVEEEAVRQKTAQETRLPARSAACRPSRRTRSSDWLSCSCPRVRYWHSDWKSWAPNCPYSPGKYHIVYQLIAKRNFERSTYTKNGFLKIVTKC